MSSKAFAGAWNIAPQTTNLIVSNYSDISNNEFNSSALEVFYERGTNKNISFIFEQSLSYDNDEFNINEGLLAIKYGIDFKNNWVGAIQFGLISEFENLQNFNEIGIESRILLGRGFNNGNWLNLEFASRNCNGYFSNKWEATLGHNFKNHDKLIFKNFGENDACNEKINRTQISYVKTINKTTNFELGTRINYETNISNNISAGIIIGIWKSF